jgi:hypothetical protein
MATTIELVTKYGDPFDEILKEVKADNEVMMEKFRQLGYDTAEKMISIIIQNKLRPQAGQDLDLENHIDVEFFEDGWGVGDIAELNDIAPYWAAINFGSAHMVGRRVPSGAFSPIRSNPDPTFFRQDRWVEGAGHWSFIVKNPIPAMNYIEKTVFWLDGEIDDLEPYTT